MGIPETLRDLTQKAQELVAEHEEQVLQAVEKAELAADQQTGGKYHEQITKAGAKTKEFVRNLKPAQ